MKRLLYFCPFVPYKYLKKLGFDAVGAYEVDFRDNLRKKEISPKSIQNKITGNLCSYLKQISNMDFSTFDGLIFTDCCNSGQRLYDYVKFYYPDKFVYLLNLPRSCTEIDLQPMIKEICSHFGVYYKEVGILNDENINNRQSYDIMVISSSMHKNYENRLKEIFSGYRLSFNTCVSSDRGDMLLNGNKDISCPRMLDYFNYTVRNLKNVSSVIFVSMQKCDNIMFSYPVIKKYTDDMKIKSILVEEEFCDEISQSSLIRYEAFREFLDFDINGGFKFN